MNTDLDTLLTALYVALTDRIILPVQNSRHYYNNPTLSQVQYGFEISGTGGRQETFAINRLFGLGRMMRRPSC